MNQPETHDQKIARLEKLGYDTWIELWVNYGCSPSAVECPARHVRNHDERMAIIRGWIKAKDQHQS